ncbi:unnamed protein product [Anisakis simplex]|uniref:Transposase n=1 Tax=Anisakis simplex TaxID=6269 RepID=A0A0M3KB75_ANISI|nr:unnamed protein product [Anisakis simplex]
MLQLNDMAFFNRDCVPTHLSLPVQSISFGNMINAATYYSHFKRETAQGQAAQQSCRWLSVLSNQRIDQAMFVDMEHDRSLLTVRFALLDGQ